MRGVSLLPTIVSVAMASLTVYIALNAAIAASVGKSSLGKICLCRLHSTCCCLVLLLPRLWHSWMGNSSQAFILWA